MKLIAHRGGFVGPENALETLRASARLGADAVECDLRRTRDGRYVVFHDENLQRLTGVDAPVSGVTCREMEELLHSAGQELLSFEALCRGYGESVPILLHMKPGQESEALAAMILEGGLPVIAGVTSRAMLAQFSQFLPPAQILAFVPSPGDCRDYYEGGAGILRLWEQWLPAMLPETVKAACPNAKIAVMACSRTEEPTEGIPVESMDGSIASLERCQALGADLMLLNDIVLGLKWRNSKMMRAN